MVSGRIIAGDMIPGTPYLILPISSSFPTWLLPPQHPTQRDLKLVDESLISQRSSGAFVLAQCFYVLFGERRQQKTAPVLNHGT